VRVEVATCFSALIDGASVAAALAVELAQEGIQGIEWRAVAAPGLARAAPEPGLTTVSLAASPCDPSARALAYEVTPAGEAEPLRGNLELARVDVAERARLVALAIAERLRSHWVVPPEAAGASDGTEREETTSEPVATAPAPALPVDASGPSPAHWTFVPAPRVRPQVDGVASRSPETVTPARPERSAQRPPPTATGAMADVAFEVRRYFGSATGIFGARAGVEAPLVAARVFRVRLHADAGAGFAMTHVKLGEVTTTSVTGTVAVLVAGAAGPVVAGIGPRVEAGWMESRGVSRATDVRSGSVAAPIATIGLEASVSVTLAGGWRGVVLADIGQVFSEVDALADGRVVAGVGGLTLGAQMGVGYAF
jgi:hypothetical protein